MLSSPFSWTGHTGDSQKLREECSGAAGPGGGGADDGGGDETAGLGNPGEHGLFVQNTQITDGEQKRDEVSHHERPPEAPG